jgi:hypothetical protein
MTEGNCNSSGRNVSFHYTARLNTSIPLEVVKFGEDGNDQEIYQLFGGKTLWRRSAGDREAIAPAWRRRRRNRGNNKLYLIFCPNVIGIGNTLGGRSGSKA